MQLSIESQCHLKLCCFSLPVLYLGVSDPVDFRRINEVGVLFTGEYIAVLYILQTGDKSVDSSVGGHLFGDIYAYI